MLNPILSFGTLVGLETFGKRTTCLLDKFAMRGTLTGALGLMITLGAGIPPCLGGVPGPFPE